LDNGGVKIKTRATLPASIDSVWEALHTPAVFTAVSAPFTVFDTPDAQQLPNRFEPERDYVVIAKAFGLVPMGQQIIHLVDDVDSWTSRSATDQGHGVSGPLSVFTGWRHQMSVNARPDGQTDFRDVLHIDTSVWSVLAWPGMQLFWLWRGMRLRALAKTFDSPITRAWNERYLSKGAMWSGKVNPVLEEVARTHCPKRALDVGAGEGADALFLAELGAETLAVEASSVGVYRGVLEQETRQAQSGARLPVSWRVADISQPWSWREGEFDFVSLQFVHTDQETRASIWSEAVSATAKGGVLLIVGHDVSDASRGIPRPPADRCFSKEELLAAIPSDWSSTEVTLRERRQLIHGNEMTVTDIVLVAKR
jgi:SAM-dependent methyltransferase